MALASGNLSAGLALFDCQRKEVPLGLNFYWSRRSNNGPRLQIKGWRSTWRNTGFGLLKLQSGRVRIEVKAVAPTETASDSESATSSSKKPNNLRRPGEKKGFVEEMRFVAMRLHTKDQAKEGEKEPESPPVIEWRPTIEGYLKFLVDSKLVFDTLEDVVEKAVHPSYTIFRNTGLERSAALAKDLEWFKEQGHSIPEPGKEGKAYADYLAKIAGENPPAFVCHYYNTYFAHSAGGRFIGKKVASMILDAKVLEFYKWDGDLPELLASVKEKLNKVAEEWTREQKDHCLEETEKSFKFSGSILQQIIT